MFVRLGIWAASLAGIAVFVAAVWLFFQPETSGTDLQVRDVVANETAAKWAIMGVLGALLGNALLFLNLRIAAQATDAANVAAAAAKEAVDHARWTSALELRPYMTAEETNFQRGLAHGRIADARFYFVWRNAGATPARNVRAFIAWRAENAGFDWARFDFPQQPSTGRDTGAIGAGRCLTVNCGVPIPIIELIGVAEGLKEIMLWGAVEYDGLDPLVRHRSEHAQRLHVPADPTDPQSSFWTTAVGRHDQSDDDCLYRAGAGPRPNERKPLPPQG